MCSSVGVRLVDMHYTNLLWETAKQVPELLTYIAMSILIELVLKGSSSNTLLTSSSYILVKIPSRSLVNIVPLHGGADENHTEPVTDAQIVQAQQLSCCSSKYKEMYNLGL